MRRAASRPQCLLHLHLSAPTEVANPNLVVTREKHVLGLEVPMHAQVLVHEVHSLADLREVTRCTGLGQAVVGLLGADRPERASSAVFQDHVNIRFVFEATQEPQYVPVPQMTLDAHLALQLRQHVSDVQWVLLHDFQRDDLAGAPVAEPADDSEGALPKHFGITLELCPQLRGELRRRLREAYRLQRRDLVGLVGLRLGLRHFRVEYWRRGLSIGGG
mmetsp:Transcript_31712/g.87570  ORF Transcript_31712/g.87570 Transcript_31712/m.87570 type:complete len:218 (+) Transcript_31712:473-1126(+)